VALARFRDRMPLIIFIVLVLVCLGLLGFACACLDEQPALALERALQAPALPALVAIWQAAVLGALAAALLARSAAPVRGRASPSMLQRFLF
jgi:CHASE1-domain containing sensor protein